jgi:hypothetical protein
MKKTIVLALALLAPLAAQAADYPISFGEVKNGVVIPGRVLKMCAKSTGYVYGFEILLPDKGTHEVSGDMRWPTDANCSSCAHATDSYGAHAGRYVKRFTFGADEKPGDYSLTIIVDHEPLTTVKFKVAPADSCP